MKKLSVLLPMFIVVATCISSAQRRTPPAEQLMPCSEGCSVGCCSDDYCSNARGYCGTADVSDQVEKFAITSHPFAVLMVREKTKVQK